MGRTEFEVTLNPTVSYEGAVESTPRRCRGRFLPLTALWVILIVTAMIIDRPVAIWAHHAGIDDAIRGKWFTRVIRFPGTFWFTLFIAGIFFFKKWIRPSQAIFLLLAGAMSGINWLIKWLVG